MANAAVGIPPAITRFVRSLGEVLYLRPEVADALGVAVTTLKAYGEADRALGPSMFVRYQSVPLFLYTDADVAALRAHIDRLRELRPDGLRPGRPGRPPLWDKEERRARQARQCRVRYLRSRARASAALGLDEVAADYQRKADVIRDGLRAEYGVRFADKTRPRVRE